MRDNSNVLIIGGAGYIGSALIQTFLQNSHSVTVYDALYYGNVSALTPYMGHSDHNKAGSFTFIKGDLVTEDWDKFLANHNFDTVINLAALVGDPLCKKYPELAEEVNKKGAIRIWDACNNNGKIQSFVFVSTCSNYGIVDTGSPAKEDSELKPLSLYAETKVAVEQHIKEHGDNTTSLMHSTILRFSTVFGISSRMRFDLTISDFVRTLWKTKELLVYDADTWRPYCHVQDICHVLHRLAVASTYSEKVAIFNVGSDAENYTKRMIVDEIVKTFPDANFKITYKDGGVDPRDYKVNFQKLNKSMLLYCYNYIPIAVSIKKVFQSLELGMFSDYESNRNFYGNYNIKGEWGEYVKDC